MRRKRFRSHLLANLSVAVAAVALYELLYAVVLVDTLGRHWFFRVHAVSLFGVVAMLMGALISYIEFHGIGSQEGVVRDGGHTGIVALTFDDGPHPEYTRKILDILAEKEVKASFFLVGKHVTKYPDVAKRIEREGHDIGNHTQTHKDLMTASRKTVMSEITKADKAISEVTGVTTRLFRPPRGTYGPATRKLLVEMGYRIVLWNVSSADWSGIPPKAIASRVIRYTKPGGIVLFHDSGALIRSEGASRGNTVKALPLIIDRLREKGYEIVPLSSMLAELDPETIRPVDGEDAGSVPSAR